MINEINRMNNLYRTLAASNSFFMDSDIQSLAEKNLSDSIKILHARSKFSLNLKNLKSFING